MESLSKLEAAVLVAMADQNPDDKDAIISQLGHARVINRQNTGAGFYTHIKIDEQSRERISRWTIGGISAAVDGLNYPVVFVLFVKDGIIDLIEGATIDIDNNTNSIDFINTRFEIIPDL